MPSSYEIPAGSAITLPWGTTVNALGTAKVENGVAYAAGSPLSFSRELGNQQTQVASAEMVGLSWQGDPINVRLIKPDGSVLLPEEDSQNVKHVRGSYYDYYFLKSPARGSWKVEISPSNPGYGGEGYSLITGLVGGTGFSL